MCSLRLPCTECVVHHFSLDRFSPDLLHFAVCLQRYSVEIHEWNGKEWLPYQADDVQLQFYMMSPYILKTLSHDGKVLISCFIQQPSMLVCSAHLFIRVKVNYVVIAFLMFFLRFLSISGL